MRIHSYIVRYDSGFAPNPFYGYCTLATCKPPIRKHANVGEWLVGCGSNEKSVRRGGHLVYAMKVTEALSFDEYWSDERFQQKKPMRSGSRKQSCGDNIYYRKPDGVSWGQLDSFHTKDDGSPKPDHIARDTGVNRVLISNDFYYFGGHGPEIPKEFRNFKGIDICKKGIGRSIFDDPDLINAFAQWCHQLPEKGLIGAPWDWKVTYA